MHPALSIIVFTTLSGAGYGLLAWVGLLAPTGRLPLAPRFGVVTLLLALAFVTAGLLSSTLHLGHPERAWRAVSQWRSSWLSREGVASLATYVPAIAFAALWLFGATGRLWSLCGVLAAVGAILTVISTAMIYRSLKPIRQWDNPWVVLNYLMLAAMSGAVWLSAMLAIFDTLSLWIALSVGVLAMGSAALKLAYWHSIDVAPVGPTLASAIGMPEDRKIRVLDDPHTEENYLLREMGYRVARRHAAKLRRIALAAAFAIPMLCVLLAWLLRGGAASALLALAAAWIATAGILVERWLFFAEATHTVALYYRGPNTTASGAPAPG